MRPIVIAFSNPGYSTSLQPYITDAVVKTLRCYTKIPFQRSLHSLYVAHISRECYAECLWYPHAI